LKWSGRCSFCYSGWNTWIGVMGGEELCFVFTHQWTRCVYPVYRNSHHGISGSHSIWVKVRVRGDDPMNKIRLLISVMSKRISLNLGEMLVTQYHCKRLLGGMRRLNVSHITVQCTTGAFVCSRNLLNCARARPRSAIHLSLSVAISN